MRKPNGDDWKDASKEGLKAMVVAIILAILGKGKNN